MTSRRPMLRRLIKSDLQVALPLRGAVRSKAIEPKLRARRKKSIVYIENAQTAVRTLTFINRLSGIWSGLRAANAAYQAIEGSRVIERVGEFDPGRGSQKCGQAAALSSLSTGQENGNYTETLAAIADTLIDRRPHLLVLPGAKTAGTNKDGASFRFRQGVFNRWLPGIAWNQVPFVQPSLDAFLREPTPQRQVYLYCYEKERRGKAFSASLPVRQSWRTHL
jgi:hypothetical protein